MSTRMLIGVALLLAQPAAGGDRGYKARLGADKASLVESLRKICPAQAPHLSALAAPESKAARRDALVALAECGDGLELYHLHLSAAHLGAGDFSAAEASAHRALRIRVTESGQLALLQALVRQKKRSPKQEADLRTHLGYFDKRTCSRDDLCAGLAYVAWHVDADAITKRAAARAIELGFSGWQPYFFGGSVYATGGAADRRKGKAWLEEAKRRGAPAAVDRLLERLGE